MPVFVDVDNEKEHIQINCDWRYKELCKSIPGSSWSTQEQVWRVPLSWTSCLALRSTFKSELQIGPTLTDWATRYLSEVVEPSVALRDLEDYEGDEDLFPHQKAGVAFLATSKRALLADEPGLGKTAQAIRALKRLKESLVRSSWRKIMLWKWLMWSWYSAEDPLK